MPLSRGWLSSGKATRVSHCKKKKIQRIQLTVENGWFLFACLFVCLFSDYSNKFYHEHGTPWCFANSHVHEVHVVRIYMKLFFVLSRRTRHIRSPCYLQTCFVLCLYFVICLLRTPGSCPFILLSRYVAHKFFY